jgi:tetratricopeptide (TPR) repeat protein
MYSDPEVREREIKNIAAVYLVIADKILPQLRRSKLQASIEVANLNDSDIKALVDAGNLDTLDVEQLIRAGNLLYGSNDVKITLFKKAAEKFKDYRAYNNLGAIYLWQNKLEEADKALTEAGNLNTAGDAKIKNNTGYLQLLNGNTDQAGKLLASAGVDESKAGLGYLAIQKGDYSQAATFLKGVKSFNEALVQVLNGQTNNAITVLSNLTSAKAYYLKAVLGARNNVEADVVNNLKKAFELDASLKNVAQSDIDFAAFQPKIQY